MRECKIRQPQKKAPVWVVKWAVRRKSKLNGHEHMAEWSAEIQRDASISYWLFTCHGIWR